MFFLIIDKFNFEKLDPDKNYSFRVEGEGEYNLALLDGDDKVIEQAILNEKFQWGFLYLLIDG